MFVTGGNWFTTPRQQYPPLMAGLLICLMAKHLKSLSGETWVLRFLMCIVLLMSPMSQAPPGNRDKSQLPQQSVVTKDKLKHLCSFSSTDNTGKNGNLGYSSAKCQKFLFWLLETQYQHYTEKGAHVFTQDTPQDSVMQAEQKMNTCSTY